MSLMSYDSLAQIINLISYGLILVRNIMEPLASGSTMFLPIFATNHKLIFYQYSAPIHPLKK